MIQEEEKEAIVRRGEIEEEVRAFLPEPQHSHNAVTLPHRAIIRIVWELIG